MRVQKRRGIALCLALLQLLLLLSACGGEEAKTTDAGPSVTAEPPAMQPPTTETPTTETPTTGGEVEEDPYLYIILDGVPQYTVVNSAQASPETNQKIRELTDALAEMTGVTFRVETDLEEPSTDYEILVCASRNREEVAYIFREMTYTEFRVDVVGERIVLATYSDYIDRLIEYFLNSIYELEEGTWVCDRETLSFTSDSVSASRSMPFYDTENGTLQGGSIYPSGRGGYTVGIDRTSTEEFFAYRSKLEGLGYTLYSENQIGLVDFAVYVNGSRTIYLQYNTSDAVKGPSVHITMTQNETLPATTAPEYETLVDARIFNPAVTSSPGGIYGYGMSLGFQLSDGSFILADGALRTDFDQSALIKIIKDGTPEGKTPTISLWLWTHAHGDHTDMARSAMGDFKREGIEVKAFAHNFPIWDNITLGDSTGDGGGKHFGDQLVILTKQLYPDSVEWVMHAGQQMFVADAVVECLWTHEEVHPASFLTLNDTGSVFSVTIDGVKTMVLGDCQTPNSKMISWYKEALRSHVVQNSHHSGNGPKKMYVYIDPMYSFWACSDEMKAERSQKLDHAQYLTTTQWTRTDETGAEVQGFRTHFTNSRYNEIYIKDIKHASDNLK